MSLGIADNLIDMAKQVRRLELDTEDLLVALKEMVDRWEPDCVGMDRVMWEKAKSAIAKVMEPAP